MAMVIKAIIAFLIVFIIILGIIYYENKNFVMTSYMIKTNKENMPKEGIRIAFLSDLHNCEYGPGNEKLYKAIVEANPEVIAIAGDMIVKEEDSDHMAALALLKRLSKRYPIYYVNGNHEKKLERMELGEDSYYKKYVTELKESGVHFVNNSSKTIDIKGFKLQFFGLDLDLSFYKKFKKKDLSEQELQELLGAKQEDAYQILLAHNPIYFDTYVKSGVDLVLSGHVHGGLVRLPFIGGVLSTQLVLFPKYDAGIYQMDQTTMILSRGLGSHTIKVRFHNKPEVIMIKLI